MTRMTRMTMDVIDLRSDTVTRPTEGMRKAMAEAELGDDVYGEDPTALALQVRAAELLGQEAALFVPTGTMANQLALLCQCERGQEVLVGEGNHVMFYESGAGAAWAQVQFSVVGQGGLFTAEEVVAAIKPLEYHHPESVLVAIENTHNRSGGRIFPEADHRAIVREAHQRGLRVHVDGARLWNAAVARGQAPSELALGVDSVSACFSKGLGAPAGSVLAGSAELIARARRYRKMLGGGMRQVGVLCAAALYALEHHRERLAEDHENAKRLAEGLANMAHVACEPRNVETNIVVFDVAGSAQAFVRAAAERGVRLNAIGERRVRAVTHLDVSRAQIEQALGVLSDTGKGADSNSTLE